MPEVAVIIGSKSDLGVAQKALEILESFNVSYELRILSAHRTPEALDRFIKEAEKKGVKVFIAMAGFAAHLPGVVAAKTVLPVIGVPISSSPLKGVDALFSIVQMPSGVPVASVGVDAAKNAALLAVSILSVSREDLRNKLEEYRKKMAEEVLEANKA